MEVKCPKCRYRYDTPVSSGVNEVACVCPRCGVPFTFAVGGGETEQPLRNHEEPMPKPENSTVATNSVPPTPDHRESAPTVQETSSATTPPPFIPSITGRRSGNRAFKPEYQRKDRGCLRNCLLVFIVSFVVAVFFIRNCNENHSYTSGSFQDKDEKYSESTIISEAEAAKADNEVPPHWLEGTWRVEAEYGVVVVTIRGNHIVEQLPNGEMNRGTFNYKDKKLYCDYGDEVVMMKVNGKKQQIIYGNQPMEKQ